MTQTVQERLEGFIARGWTVNTLARSMGVGWHTVDNWRNGREPRIGKLIHHYLDHLETAAVPEPNRKPPRK